MNILITAGGTGGHIYPAKKLGEELQSSNNVTFIASNRRVDEKILNDAKWETHFLKMNGFSRGLGLKCLLKNFINIFYMFYITFKTIKIIKKNKINHVIGFGGFITFPVIMAAKFMGLKTSIHEQNSFPGLVNRKLAKKVDVIFYTYKSSVKHFSTNKNKIIYSSNPRIDEANEFKGLTKKDYILFLGGSLGSETINKLAYDFSLKYKVPTILVSGGFEHGENMYLDVFDFLPEQLKYIAEAKAVITRGGATTLVECEVLSQKTIVIPSPNVVANHQLDNGLEMEEKGTFKVLTEDDVTIEKIYDEVNKVVNYNNNKQINSCEIIINKIKELNG